MQSCSISDASQKYVQFGIDAQFGRGAGPCGSGFGSLVSAGAARPKVANVAVRQP